MPTWTLPFPKITSNHLYQHSGSFWEPSPWYARFRDEVGIIVRQSLKTVPPEVWLRFDMMAWCPDKRKRDLDNLLKPSIDAVRLALGFDDSWIAHIESWKRYDPANPRLEVQIERIGREERSPW